MLHAIPDAVFLHVEDNPADATLFSDVLQSVTGNVRVRRVSSIASALDLLDVEPGGALPVDCVVTSLSLAGADTGGELARRLRQRFDAATLPIVGLAHDMPAGADTSWFDAVYQKSASRRGLRPVVQAIVSLWFGKARRFHC